MQLPASVHNRLSYAGAAIAALALSAMVFLFIVNTLVGRGEAPYAGLIIFILLPAVLLSGLLLIPLGMWREHRHVRRTGHASIPRFPVIDLNDARQRTAAVIFVLGSVFLLFLTVFGSFQAYEATESVAFCGSTCHTVMEPEKVAHQDSPHARVRCVECHVGPGADWYVKSKLAGAHQLYAVLTDTYQRPIPVPVRDLRPARDTCEHCHWQEQHDTGLQLKRRVYFMPDEDNTRWEVGLLSNVGAGTGAATGIHWHLSGDHQLEYIATDPQRQQIPWMRVTDRRTGKTTEYLSTDSPLTPAEVAAAEVRTMDCLDCHNRPSHHFRSPGFALDRSLQAGAIDAHLPMIKQTATELLTAEYDSTPAALEAIAQGLEGFYREQHPAVLGGQRAELTNAVSAVQEIYRRNFFPAMKVRWDAYPDNSQHMTSPGCFRCHDGLHENDAGEALTASCTACHVIATQGRPDALAHSTEPDGLAFEHPPAPDVGDSWEGMACPDCHAEP